MNIERIALGFALAAPEIPTTLFSTSKVAKLVLNLEQATGVTPLTATELRVCDELRERFFSSASAVAVRSWEGVEPQKVHAKLARLLMLEWYAGIAVRGGWGGRGVGCVLCSSLQHTSALALLFFFTRPFPAAPLPAQAKRAAGQAPSGATVAAGLSASASATLDKAPKSLA